MIGLLTTGSSGLGWLAVIGRSLVPSPPAMTTALTGCQRSLQAQRPRPAAGSVAGRICIAEARRRAAASAQPVRGEQAAGLLGVECGSPPVQCSSPERERPTEYPGECCVRRLVRTKKKQGKSIEKAQRGRFADETDLERAVSAAPERDE